jgi:hypothetical protein
MSFNRLKYDFCEEKNTINQSIRPGDYKMNTPVTCNGCFQVNPSVVMQKGGVSLQKDTPWRFYNGPIDVESELKNITRPATKCPTFKYQPKCENTVCLNQGHPCGQGVVKGCENSDAINKEGAMGNDNLVDLNDCLFPVENTRLSNPPCTLRGTGINRFNPLCLDPQDQIFYPGEYQIPTRLVVKDNHRPCVPTPAINSLDPNMPDPECKKINGVCANNTLPMYRYDVCG